MRRPELLAASILLTAGLPAAGCSDLRALIVGLYPSDYSAEAGALPGTVGFFDGADAARATLPLRLDPVADGLTEPTDIQFPPGQSDMVVVLEKSGEAVVFDVNEAGWTRRSTLVTLDVLSKSEQGLLGLAFHPRFPAKPMIYLNYSTESGGREVSRVSEWTVDPATWTASAERIVLEVAQPYANHNGGQLAFGPDGMLYIGWGDGGWMGDPDGNGQNPATWLGAMLRIDIDAEARPYGVPADNPFVGCGADKACPALPNPDGGPAPAVRPEIYAIGLRNPWRHSFAPDGRPIVADVGQDMWEELSLVPPGANLGWPVREGRHCYKPTEGCAADGMVDPFYEYSHAEGMSITGGHVYLGRDIPELSGRYVFADFVTGRLWAVDVPDRVGGPLVEATALGRWKILPSSFGRDAAGELYVADYVGVIYRLRPG